MFKFYLFSFVGGGGGGGVDQQNRALKPLPLHYATSRPYVHQWENARNIRSSFSRKTRILSGKLL